VLAMLLPGTDPISMLLELVPLILLYESSVLLARVFGRAPEPSREPEITVSEPPPRGAG
jgi:Sec-independent protein secretion pathway component TatC